ncbi:hypothetical protein [Dickeya chrysanthemi]|uniref:Zinc ribbon domain-containing protein n=1 Tax=Dickeya chrysanthemi TaxID=556 RepID=A0ABU8JQK6_DICCH|nr:hypothetical protein [Dickeya chrysanthemi]
MALTKCKECKKEVSTSAKVCPHCGVKNPSTTAGQVLWSWCYWFGVLQKSLAEVMTSPPQKLIPQRIAQQMTVNACLIKTGLKQHHAVAL